MILDIKRNIALIWLPSQAVPLQWPPSLKPSSFNDSASHVSNPPPSYDAFSSTFVSADSVQCKRPLLSSPQSKRERRARALSCIREIVSYPDFNPTSVESTVNSCAATLSAADFSNLVQQLSFEGHTALYWAIVNNRREAFWAINKFISEFSPACTSDLRRACMAVNDHDLFMQLNLGRTFNTGNDESLRRMLLACPQDKIDVFQHGLPQKMVGRCPLSDIEVHKPGDDYFFVAVAFRMFQTRLRTISTLKLVVEFIVRGRIWMLKFYMGSDGQWYVGFCLSDHSLPVLPDAIISIMAHRPRPGSDTPKHLVLDMRYPSHTLVPKVSSRRYTPTAFNASREMISKRLGDWPMDNDTEYVDSG
ncbi:hypothetical protein DEU56DRAFT_899729 [Suillus clintonianus]|uniref:uncharacterized protein n=1 Tax=Suillus clintonianus TaxID=1904413 RepID=UPI001B87B9BD|nr:uncharacterized protein DEU56DRAFT_899729 [Suillus clintonianus]KAG2146284.1 hypothetical protein DEU56DRAFT_899729 [Suillus clintonianus]